MEIVPKITFTEQDFFDNLKGKSIKTAAKLLTKEQPVISRAITTDLPGDDSSQYLQISAACLMYVLLRNQVDIINKLEDSNYSLPRVSNKVLDKFHEDNIEQRIYGIREQDEQLYDALSRFSAFGNTEQVKEDIMINGGLVYLLLQDSLEYNPRLDVYDDFVNNL